MKIYIITTISYFHFPRHYRSWGYYFSEEEADEILEKNIGSLHESLYDYAVIEEYLPGICREGKQTSWWKYKDHQWTKIQGPPERMQDTINYALG